VLGFLDDLINITSDECRFHVIEGRRDLIARKPRPLQPNPHRLELFELLLGDVESRNQSEKARLLQSLPALLSVGGSLEISEDDVGSVHKRVME
jgi:hypothetical protein